MKVGEVDNLGGVDKNIFEARGEERQEGKSERGLEERKRRKVKREVEGKEERKKKVHHINQSSVTTGKKIH